MRQDLCLWNFSCPVPLIPRTVCHDQGKKESVYCFVSSASVLYLLWRLYWMLCVYESIEAELSWHIIMRLFFMFMYVRYEILPLTNDNDRMVTYETWNGCDVVEEWRCAKWRRMHRYRYSWEVWWQDIVGIRLRDAFTDAWACTPKNRPSALAGVRLRSKVWKCYAVDTMGPVLW